MIRGRASGQLAPSRLSWLPLLPPTWQGWATTLMMKLLRLPFKILRWIAGSPWEDEEEEEEKRKKEEEGGKKTKK